jgi:hypothetical protein
MNLEEKAEYIIDNEGCEFADGLSGLRDFCKYCQLESFEKIIQKYKNDIEQVFEEVYEETQWTYKEDHVEHVLEDMKNLLYSGLIDKEKVIKILGLNK